MWSVLRFCCIGINYSIRLTCFESELFGVCVWNIFYETWKEDLFYCDGLEKMPVKDALQWDRELLALVQNVDITMVFNRRNNISTTVF